MKSNGTFIKDDRVNGILAVSRALGDNSLNLCRIVEVFKYKKSSMS